MFSWTKKGEHTINFLEKNFKTLKNTKFISYFQITKINITEDEETALRFLLNDIRENDEYDDQDIVKYSLKRGIPF